MSSALHVLPYCDLAEDGTLVADVDPNGADGLAVVEEKKRMEEGARR